MVLGSNVKFLGEFHFIPLSVQHKFFTYNSNFYKCSPTQTVHRTKYGCIDIKQTLIHNFCRILTMVCWYWTNCTFGLYPSSDVSKKLRNKNIYTKKSQYTRPKFTQGSITNHRATYLWFFGIYIFIPQFFWDIRRWIKSKSTIRSRLSFSRSSRVSIAIWLWARRPGFYSQQRQETDFFSLPRPDKLWGPPSLLSNGCRG
jgi:hypothetical protein